MKGVAAVVVLYHPSSILLENLSTYRQQVDHVFVVDNSEHLERELTATIAAMRGVEYVSNGRNLGIAAALNIGAGLALRRRCSFLLTMDQDSAATPGMVQKLVVYASGHPKAGLVTPFHMDRNAPETLMGPDIEKVVTTMTSGSLLNLAAYSDAGEFLEKLFIDYVDDEYCFRLQSRGYQVVRLRTAILHHSLGHMTVRKFFGRTVRPTHHSPERYFYQARNRVYLRSRYRDQFPQYFRYESKLQLGRLTKMILFERHRFRKCVMVVRGTVAGLRGDFSQLRTT
ncbi:MAG: hypothetical protein A2X67_03110 [Ignavibacteria bacterium GWA2_55_11]|nr:MAG: hypothetical protein A2X67_03110 [Ignavibacteria bacterium GWA2_55_11]OGU63667.1 MAG: hypothetical protein A3C56_00925 [Ignavibacteria bacterium RIFCSPHIGHO2_02_FULL_56_12]OGU69753.1 MAG: hypothetical protein A3H45_11890 [Ignavibacteria bacterium RIFCSPLOWO2_02_FULL_55_14]OGU75903.1 MAG: hypothetical protein A3G43_08905 [Ignavibacteria bacterium RIFCSPLOWO2_12_FULL_56_21]